MQKIPRLLLIIDGMGDLPSIELDNKTPLQAAKLPILDKLAQKGQCGSAYPIEPGIVPTTVSGTLAVLGFDSREKNISRGVVEAIGCGFEINHGDVALRGNWGTIDNNGYIVDRRAGRIRQDTKKLSKSLNGLKIEDVEIFVYPGTEHRIAIILRGEELNDQLKGSDPCENFYTGMKPFVPKSLYNLDKKSSRTAKILNIFEIKAREILKKHPVNIQRESKNLPPANIILSREPGKIDHLPKLKSNSGNEISGIFITGDDTISGIARMLGQDVLNTKNMTANLDTNINEKFAYAKKFLKNYELVTIHFKGCDIASHNKDPKNKKIFLEKIDSELGFFLEDFNYKLNLCITADHGTSSKDGNHIDDPVPLLLYGTGFIEDSVKGFDEYQVKYGKFGTFKLHKFWDFFFV